MGGQREGRADTGGEMGGKRVREDGTAVRRRNVAPHQVVWVGGDLERSLERLCLLQPWLSWPRSDDIQEE